MRMPLVRKWTAEKNRVGMDKRSKAKPNRGKVTFIGRLDEVNE